MAKRQSINGLWKTFERIVARDFGTERNPLSGENSRHDTNSDSLHKRVYIEAKRDQKYFGKTFRDLVHDTFEKAKREKKIPMIALKEKGKQGYLIVVRSTDLKKLAKEMI
jgi:hypothetical protein